MKPLVFDLQHGARRSLAALVGGPALGDVNACFRPALRSDSELIAADLRPVADGRRITRLKLVARMLGVGFDERVQPDRFQRRHKKLVAEARRVFHQA